MKLLTVAMLGFYVGAGACSAAEIDLYRRLKAAAAEQDPNYPDGVDLQLTHFSLVCNLARENGAGDLYVVDQRAVLTGMQSPRGQNAISLFDSHFKFLGRISYVMSRPLWCDSAKLFLFGAWDGALPGDQLCSSDLGCNVFQWDDLNSKIKMSHEKQYGSSGGVDDP
jgi:hypothetical protein